MLVVSDSVATGWRHRRAICFRRVPVEDHTNQRSVKASNNSLDRPATALRRVNDGVLPGLLSLVPAPLFQTMLGISPIIPYYHIVSDEEVPHVKHLYRHRNVRQFAQDLDFFLSNYEPLALQDLVEHFEGKKSLPKRCFLLTFDDGFREMHDVVAPILRAKGVPAIFFLTTGFVDNADMAHHCKLSLLLDHLARVPGAAVKEQTLSLLARNRVEGGSFESQMVSICYRQRHLVEEIAALCGYDFGQYLSSRKPHLTSDQIRSLLRQGFAFGAHSIDHPLYADLPLEEQVRQTNDSRQFLIERFQIDCRAFAFPHSDAGVTAAFFETLFAPRQLAVSFGTGGMVRHFFARNLERFSMEKAPFPARGIVAKHYARGLCKRLTGKSPVPAPA